MLSFAAKVTICDCSFVSFVVTDDAGEEKLGYRMRNSQVNKVPYTVVIGDHERDEGTVTYRHFGCKAQHTVKFDEFINLLKEEIETKALPKYEE